MTSNKSSAGDFGGLTAAERIIAEKAPYAYRFAPGITITPPSKRRIQTLYDVINDFGDDPTEDQMTSLMQILIGDQWEAVLDYLDDVPVDAYVPLFLDLFENVLRMCPSDVDVDSLLGSAESRWREIRPDMFDKDGSAE